jgi:hypothetical protein
MDKLGDLIKVRLNKHSIGTSATSAEVVYFANQLLKGTLEFDEKDVNAHTFTDGILSVKVSSPTWSQEVWGNQKVILKDLQKRFGENAVKKILIKSV